MHALVILFLVALSINTLILFFPSHPHLTPPLHKALFFKAKPLFGTKLEAFFDALFCLLIIIFGYAFLISLLLK